LVSGSHEQPDDGYRHRDDEGEDEQRDDHVH
jgi:hypothetical protein